MLPRGSRIQDQEPRDLRCVRNTMRDGRVVGLLAPLPFHRQGWLAPPIGHGGHGMRARDLEQMPTSLPRCPSRNRILPMSPLQSSCSLAATHQGGHPPCSPHPALPGSRSPAPDLESAAWSSCLGRGGPHGPRASPYTHPVTPKLTS